MTRGMLACQLEADKHDTARRLACRQVRKDDYTWKVFVVKFQQSS